MEDVEFRDNIGLDVPHVDDDSGSAYEEPSSDAEANSSQDERRRVSRALSTALRRRRSRGRKELDPTRAQDDFSRGQSNSPQAGEEIHANALPWATTSDEPQPSTDVKSPARNTAGTKPKRKAEVSASQSRAKRLKGFYNNNYRELLNIGIHEAVTRAIPDEYPPPTGSQIGSSGWNKNEKDIFFSILSRLGRHDVRGIALHIGSKSELEVQEYIQVLEQGLKGREDSRQTVFDLTDFPAAVEISDECTTLLERAGDALASRQECSEEKKEQAKWGDFWLLTTDTLKSIEKQKESGEQSVKESLPATNLLDLKNWLELSRNVFMNSSGDENWQSFAEPGETPAIRATAFEDFHSLTVSITKRLISTVLFCAMSRRRAIHSMGDKYAEISVDDVEAAVNVLGLKQNSLDFWAESARRHSFSVVGFDEDSWQSFDLTYDEVEAALRHLRRPSRSRSRSISRQSHSRKSGSVDGNNNQNVPIDSATESLGSDDDADHESGQSDHLSNPSLDDEIADLSDDQDRSQTARLEAAEKKKAETSAQEAYIESYDHEKNEAEENRLLKLLGQSLPTEIKLEQLDTSEQHKKRKKEAAAPDWRDHIEYWSPWETMPTPVPGESFTKNRNRISRMARKHMRKEESRHEVSSEDGESLRDEAEADELNISSDGKVEVRAPEESGEPEEPEEPADAQMKYEANGDLYAASSSEKEPSLPRSPMSDDASGRQYHHLTHRTRLSDEEIAIRSDEY